MAKNTGMIPLNLSGFNTPLEPDDYFDVKGKKYMSVVYEMAIHGDLNYTVKKTGIDNSDLLLLINTEHFKNDLERIKKEINSKGVSTIDTKLDIYEHIALDRLNEIINDKMQKTSDTLKAVELMLTAKGTLSNKEEKGSGGQMVQINIKSSRDRENDIITIENK